MKKKKQIVETNQTRRFRRFQATRERLKSQAELIRKQLLELDERIKSLSK